MSGEQPTPPAYGHAPAPGHQAPPPPFPQAPHWQQPYGHPQQAWTPAPAVPKHPSATTALVLGIIGVSGVLLGGVGTLVSPVAWWIAHRTLRDIDEAEPGTFDGHRQAEAGRALGVIGTILLVLVVIFWVMVIGLAAWNGSSDLATD